MIPNSIFAGLVPLGTRPVIIYSASVATGHRTVTIAPGQGQFYLIAHLAGYHDDPAGQACYWSITDGATTIVRPTVAALAISARVNCNALDPNTAPLRPDLPMIWLPYGWSFIWDVANLAAGKKAYVEGLVYDLRGFDIWGGG